MPMGGVKKKKKGGAKQKRAEEGKTRQKNTAKNMEDKTFGLKNKNKSRKVQQHIRQVKQQINTIGKTAQDIKREKKKKEEAKQKKEAAKLLKMQKAIMVAKGEVKECPFFLKGTCRKGKHCLFSHANKGKLSLYVDERDKEGETMDTWSQETLEAAVKRKDVRRPNQTDIICRYFLDAIESSKYGHFWKCENGRDCIYRHKLPPGFVLKKQKTADELLAEKEAADIAEEVEALRAKLVLSECTPLTFEIFQQWRTHRKALRDAEIEAERKTAAKSGGGKGTHVLSGRALFEYDPTMFTDDADAAGEDELVVDDEKEEETTPEAAAADEAAPAEAEPTEKKAEETVVPKKKKKRRKKKKVAEGAAAAALAPAATPAPVAVTDVPVDASLFMDDEALPDSDED